MTALNINTVTNEGSVYSTTNRNNYTNTEDKFSGARKKPTSDDRRVADGYLTYLIEHYDYQSATELYLTSKYGYIRPKAFMSYSEGQITKLYDHRTKTGERSWLYLLDKMQEYGLVDLCFVTVSTKMLGLSAENEDFNLFYDKANIKAWQTALENNFSGPLRWVLEAKPTTGQIHAHCLTDFSVVLNPLILAAANTKAVIPIRSTKALLEKARYTFKEQLHFPTPKYPDKKQFEVYVLARQSLNRLPNTRGSKGIPKLAKIKSAAGKIDAPIAVKTPTVYGRARFYLTRAVMASKQSAKQAAAHYLTYYPDVPPNTFKTDKNLTFDRDTLAEYIQFCRVEFSDLPKSKAVEKIFTPFVHRNNSKRFISYLHHPDMYLHNLKRRQHYRKKSDFYE